MEGLGARGSEREVVCLGGVGVCLKMFMFCVGVVVVVV